MVNSKTCQNPNDIMKQTESALARALARALASALVAIAKSDVAIKTRKSQCEWDTMKSSKHNTQLQIRMKRMKVDEEERKAGRIHCSCLVQLNIVAADPLSFPSSF